MKKIVAKFLLIMFIIVPVMTGCSGTKSETPKIAELNIAASPGPASFPLAHMVENNTMQDVADKTVLAPWSTGDQLKAMVTSGQAQIVNTPINNAIMLYNKGAKVKLLNVAVWGMLYVISSDENVKSIADLKGKEISVAGKGGIHDLILRHLLIKNNIDPEKDIKLSYMDMTEAQTKLITGELKYALLNEPGSSMALVNGKKNGAKLFRVLDISKEWAALTGKQEAKIPWAGFIVVGDNAQNEMLVDTFLSKFAESAKHINENAATIGSVVEKHLSQMKAPAVAASIPYSRLEPVTADQCQKDIEEFFNELLTTAPAESIGGKLPDGNFYYKAAK